MRLQAMKEARERAAEMKRVHQHFQTRRGPRLPRTVSLERRAS